MTVPVNRCDPYTTCGGVKYTGVLQWQRTHVYIRTFLARNFEHVEIALTIKIKTMLVDG